MQIGAVLSQHELGGAGGDVGGLRAYAQAVQDLGYDFLVTADHVVGADPAAHPDLARVYPLEGVLHEPFALCAFLAGVATRLGLLTSVVILPLRPLDGGWATTMEKLHGWLREAGRDPATFGVEGRLDAAGGTPDDWRRTVELWRGFGATHLSVSTGGLGGPDAHVQRLREVQQ